MRHKLEKLNLHFAGCLDAPAIEELIRIAVGLPNNPAGDSKGGFLTFMNTESFYLASGKFGTVLEKKTARYARNSIEKATRLFREPKNWRTFQSRNKRKQYWGGGSRYKCYICAFSGFPEKIDEAISLIYAIYIYNREYLSPEQFLQIVIKQQNGTLGMQPCEDYKDNEFIVPIAKEFMNFYRTEQEIRESQ